MEAVGASERVLGYLDAEPSEQVEGKPGRTVPGWGGGIRLRDVTFEYPTRPGRKALDGVTIDVEERKVTALVGYSGSGKSTVVSLLQRLYDADSGAVELVSGGKAVDLKDVDAGWYRSQVRFGGLVD